MYFEELVERRAPSGKDDVLLSAQRSSSAGQLSMLLFHHGFTCAAQFSQFDLRILRSVQGHLTVLPGRIRGPLMRLACCYLVEFKRLTSLLHHDSLVMQQFSFSQVKPKVSSK